MRDGNSEAARAKNKVRQAITGFFRDRDCACLVRPLTDETNLQSLDTLPLDSLRPQFVDQMSQLRRRVLGRARPK